MIVGSLLILVAAAGLLAAGLMKANDTFLVLSILASVVAGVGLFFGARAAARYGDEDDVADTGEASRVREPAFRPRRLLEDEKETRVSKDDEPLPPVQPSAAVRERLALRDVVSVEGGSVTRAVVSVGEAADDDDGETDLSDEPAAVPVSRIDATRLAGLAIPVQVVDGRPRYHLAGCVHLLGKDDEALPVNEAAELGFSPCSLCEPTADVLADLSVRSGQ